MNRIIIPIYPITPYHRQILFFVGGPRYTAAAMTHPLLQKLNGQVVTIIACALVLVVYGVRAYRSMPTTEQTRYHSWLTENRDRLLSADPVPVEISVSLIINGNKTNWSLESKAADEEHNRKLARLLELAETSEVFLYDDSHSKRNASVITVRIEGEEYTALLGRTRIEHNPALQTFLRLSRLYAEEKTTTVQDTNHANS